MAYGLGAKAAKGLGLSRAKQLQDVEETGEQGHGRTDGGADLQRCCGKLLCSQELTREGSLRS